LVRGLGKQGREVDGKGHVVKYKAEMRMGEKVLDILPATGNEVICLDNLITGRRENVEADDLMAFGQEAVAKVGT
jgi:hypothetical protein